MITERARPNVRSAGLGPGPSARARSRARSRSGKARPSPARAPTRITSRRLRDTVRNSAQPFAPGVTLVMSELLARRAPIDSAPRVWAITAAESTPFARRDANVRSPVDLGSEARPVGKTNPKIADGRQTAPPRRARKNEPTGSSRHGPPSREKRTHGSDPSGTARLR